jgi:hypothetical protein
MATSLAAIAAQSFALLNVFLPGESVPAADGAFALNTANLMIGTWAQQMALMPSVSREVFALVAGKRDYTIGPTGDWVAVRPPNGDTIEGLAILWAGASPQVETQRALYNDDEYNAIAVKDLPGSVFVGAVYNATFASGLGTFSLWPVPNVSTNSFVLYRTQPIPTFVSLVATYDLPPGYEEAIVMNLAKRLATPYGKTLDPITAELAITTVANLKRSNAEGDDLETPDLFVQSGHGYGYDINVGNG